MTDDQTAIRRARRALEAAADEAALEHPGVDALEAYVEGRLDADARAEIERLATALPVVAEDLADLQAVHDQMRPRPAARRDIRWGRVAAAAGLAATLVLGVWLGTRPDGHTGESVALAGLTAAERGVVDRALAAGRVEVPEAVMRLQGTPGTLLGDTPAAVALAPTSPRGTFVRATRPTFTWSDAGASAYTVAVFDEAFNEVARSPRMADTIWTPDVDLAPGATYVWQVTAHRADGDETAPRPPAPDARFTVIDAAAAARVDDLRARGERDPLALGVLLADAGLLLEARAELERAAATPETGEAARRLLQSLP